VHSSPAALKYVSNNSVGTETQKKNFFKKKGISDIETQWKRCT
jgi:hypothetical protein